MVFWAYHPKSKNGEYWVTAEQFEKKREKYNKWISNRTHNDPLFKRNYNLRAKYKIDSDKYAEILRLQGGKCGICGDSECASGNHFLSVDHSHTTGAVRGVLCLRCNTGIGQFKDDPALLRAAAAYLETGG
jgi:hypothetical protein